MAFIFWLKKDSLSVFSFSFISMLKLGLFEVSPILGLYRKYHSSRFGLKENTLYIIDGTSLLFNAYFGKANLQSKRNVETSKGVNVNAIAIMVSKLCTFTEEVNCKHMALVFDRPADFGDASGSSEVRKSLLPGYKSNRMKKDPEVRAQFPLVQPIFEALGFPCFSQSGCEADDVMATISRHCLENSLMESIIHVSPDKDMLQLIQSGGELKNSQNKALGDVRVIKQMHSVSSTMMDMEAIIAKFGGLKPEHLNDYFALVGDTSDNIPGVFGVGHKASIALITTFQSVEGLYQSLGLDGQKSNMLSDDHAIAILRKCFRDNMTRQSPSKIWNALKNVSYKEILLYKRLVTLIDDIPAVQDRLKQHVDTNTNPFGFRENISNRMKKSIILDFNYQNDFDTHCPSETVLDSLDMSGKMKKSHEYLVSLH